MASANQVQWRDLLSLGRWRVANELLLSLPWLIASWIATFHGAHFVGLACSFMFFLTGLRQVHNAFHSALGLPRFATQSVMFILSILMLGSMHAVQVCHLRHHRYCMKAEDVEAMSACMPWWQAILIGPFFPLRLHWTAITLGSQRQRGWIVAELVGNVAWVTLVLGALDLPWLKFHVLAMALGQCLTAFFAVWTVHHDCEHGSHVARTMRGGLKTFLTYSMFFHNEHHLFPAVPTCRLKLLAKRLDAAAPELTSCRVF